MGGTRLTAHQPEVGAPEALAGLVGDASATPVVSLDAGGPSLRGLLQAVGAAFVLGVAVAINEEKIFPRFAFARTGFNFG